MKERFTEELATEGGDPEALGDHHIIRKMLSKSKMTKEKIDEYYWASA